MPPMIHVIAIGRCQAPLSEQIERYQVMIRAYASLQIDYIKPPSIDNTKILIAKEAALLTGRCPPQAHTIALSEEGRKFESRPFARWLSGLLESGRPPVFIIGGSYGLDPVFKAGCRELISLSPLTFSHQICLLVLVEQLYRATTILHDHPYHK
jgi:23S rRNA (pseudouridine1915-N3)-methyltransferase